MKSVRLREVSVLWDVRLKRFYCNVCENKCAKYTPPTTVYPKATKRFIPCAIWVHIAPLHSPQQQNFLLGNKRRILESKSRTREWGSLRGNGRSGMNRAPTELNHSATCGNLPRPLKWNVIATFDHDSIQSCGGTQSNVYEIFETARIRFRWAYERWQKRVSKVISYRHSMNFLTIG